MNWCIVIFLQTTTKTFALMWSSIYALMSSQRRMFIEYQVKDQLIKVDFLTKKDHNICSNYSELFGTFSPSAFLVSFFTQMQMLRTLICIFGWIFTPSSPKTTFLQTFQLSNQIDSVFTVLNRKKKHPKA